MRVKNKEIRQRRHRKEQKIKEAARELRAQYGEKKTAPAAKPKAPAKKASAPKPADAKPKAAAKPKKTEE